MTLPPSADDSSLRAEAAARAAELERDKAEAARRDAEESRDSARDSAARAIGMVALAESRWKPALEIFVIVAAVASAAFAGWAAYETGNAVKVAQESIESTLIFNLFKEMRDLDSQYQRNEVSTEEAVAFLETIYLQKSHLPEETWQKLEKNICIFLNANEPIEREALGNYRKYQMSSDFYQFVLGLSKKDFQRC